MYNVHPVHLLRVFLLRVLESNFPGDSLYNYTDMRIPTLKIKSLLESNPLKPELLVGGLGVAGWMAGSKRVLRNPFVYR